MESQFAVEAGLAALNWLVRGYGYENSAMDVVGAYSYTIDAAQNAKCKAQTLERIRSLANRGTPGDPFVSKILSQEIAKQDEPE